MSLSVHDVAAYILKKQGEMSAMKLQKLVYYSQAWSLVWDEKPLFRAQIEAWAIFHALWWDPEHEVFPAKKRNT